MNRRLTAARLLPLLIALAPVAMMAVSGCQTGPFGRQRIVAVSPDEELRLGSQAYRQVLADERENVLPNDAPVSRRLLEVGVRLARASEDPAFRTAAGLTRRQRFEWDFKVVADEQVNAFCLPGGKVVFYTGILPVCRTDAGMAVVMGHEVSHALARHGAERMSQQQLVQAGAVAASAGLGTSDLSDRTKAGLMVALNAGTKFGLLAYSRAHESEADRMGLLLMAAAGYDPAEAPAFWERMNASGGGGKGPGFLSTHPSHTTRIADLRKWQAEAATFHRDPQPDRALPSTR